MTGICDACGRRADDLTVINNTHMAGICVCGECRSYESPELQIEEVEVETDVQRNQRRLRELEKSFHIPCILDED